MYAIKTIEYLTTSALGINAGRETNTMNCNMINQITAFIPRKIETGLILKFILTPSCFFKRKEKNKIS